MSERLLSQAQAAEMGFLRRFLLATPTVEQPRSPLRTKQRDVIVVSAE